MLGAANKAALVVRLASHINIPGRAKEDSPCTWTPAGRVREQVGMPHLDLTAVTIWGIHQQIKEVSFFSFFQINKIFTRKNAFVEKLDAI